MLYYNADDYWEAKRKRKEYENSPGYKLAGAQREFDGTLRLAFIKRLLETGGLETYTARLRMAKGTDAQRQVYLEMCAEFGIEAAGIDAPIQSAQLKVIT